MVNNNDKTEGELENIYKPGRNTYKKQTISLNRKTGSLESGSETVILLYKSIQPKNLEIILLLQINE